jgi:hypothetical protein
MKKEDDDKYACYKFSDKLRGKKWRNYTMDGLNMTLRGDYTKSLSLKGQYGKNIRPPVGLHFKILTEDVPAETTKNKGEKYLDAGHINYQCIHTYTSHHHHPKCKASEQTTTKHDQ